MNQTSRDFPVRFPASPTDASGGMIIDPGSPQLAEAIENEIAVWQSGKRVRRLWSGDATLWSGTDEDKWLGWLPVAEEELAALGKLESFAADVKRQAFADVVLLGMGGSSLGPEVLAESYGQRPGWPRFHMLDATDPAQVAALERDIDIRHALFIVSSKSGSTLEPTIFMEYFLDRVGTALGKDKAGAHFVAVTDPGSALEKQAKARGFAHIFMGIPTIGGRYSVLSKFGLVPAAAIGIELGPLLATAAAMAQACGPETPVERNPGVRLGIALGIAATRFGRDKLTILASPRIADLGAWLEQLVAESTGKHGKGIIPLTGEPAGKPELYGADRFFAYLELKGDVDPAQRAAVAALEQAGHPVARIALTEMADIGREFFRWEIATATVGAVLGINPFDQPDVEASKVKTKALTQDYEKTRRLPDEAPLFREGAIALHASSRDAADLGPQSSLADYLKSHFARLRAGDYVALLGYIERKGATVAALTSLRALIRDKTRAATCVGFGPRFLHSTGQAYKGGPNTGLFVQITCDDPADLPVPGHGYSFGVVKACQAAGDLSVLEERGRRALRLHLADVETGLEELARAVALALG